MKKTGLFLLACIMGLLPGKCLAQWSDNTVYYDIPFHTAVNEKGENETLKADVYMPGEVGYGPVDIILWFHGGGFRPGNDKQQSYIVSFCKEYAGKGFICVSADYRLRENPRADFRGTLEDVLSDATAILERIEGELQQNGVETGRFYVAGGSAGGWLSVNLMARYPELLETHAIPPRVSGYICLWGALDQKDILAPVTAQFPPTLFVHGTADKAVPAANAVNLDHRLRELGVPSTLFLIEGAGHTPMAHRDEIVSQIDRFLEAHR